MTRKEGLDMLLQVGGVAVSPHAPPPPAALEVVALCAGLPLAIALAGSLLQEHADDWTEALVPLLSSDNQAEIRKRSATADDEMEEDDAPTAEERIVSTSLNYLRSKAQHGPAVLFSLFAIFPQEIAIPCAVLDAIEPTLTSFMARDATRRGFAPQRVVKISARRWALALLHYSLLNGSVKEGIQIHHLVHGYTLAAAGIAGLRNMQRSAVADLLAALESEQASKALTQYARAHLRHHVSGAMRSELEADGASLLDDEMLLPPLLDHADAMVRSAIADALGPERLTHAAQRAHCEERWLMSAQLWSAASNLLNGAPTASNARRAAWDCLKRIDPVSTKSVELEAAVIRGLVLKSGGIKIGSVEHDAANARIAALLETVGGRGNDALTAARASTLSMAYFYEMCAAASVHERDGCLEAYAKLFDIGGVRTATKLGASEGAGRAVASLQQLSFVASLLHQSGAYDWDADFGASGCWLREAVGWYTFAEVHKQFKESNGRDTLLSGLGGALLLLRWGDLDGSRASWRACIANWELLASEIQKGVRKWSAHSIDLVDMRAARAIALSTGQWDVVRALFAASPEGDEGNPSELEAHTDRVTSWMGTWGMQCTWTSATALLAARMLRTLLVLDGSAALLSAPDWLPPLPVLIQIAETEKAWDVLLTGAQHPTMLAALLHARLQQWAAAAELAEAVLAILVQPLTRIEAWRLLARCRAAMTSSADAHEPLQHAAEEAEGAGYLWLQLLVRRDLYQHDGCSRADLSKVGRECH